MLNLASYVQRQAAAAPRRLALCAEGEQLTYAELARRAANLASALRDSGALRGGSGTLAPDGRDASDDYRSPALRGGSTNLSRPCVGVIASRSTDACVAVLGCAWAGATYVPIGVKTPVDRLHRLLALCTPTALIADTPGSRLLGAALRAPAAPEIAFAPHAERLRDERVHDLHSLPDVAPPAMYEFAPRDLAYIMFTSGSTGVPKGVMISQASAAAFIEMIGERLQLTPEDRTLEVTELGFDVSVLNMFATWQAQASLHVLPAVRVMNAVGFAREQRLTVWSSTPSLISLLRQVKALAPEALPDVRLAIFIGEPLSAATLDAFRAAAPRCVVEDLYGPTETTVVNTGQRVQGSAVYTPGRDVLSIGTALPGNRAAVVTAERRWAAVGEPGELALSGVQLAEGYLGAPELTAQRFPVLDGERWYLTGDAAFCDERGLLHHLGRLDNQVKILGNRVELDEIEMHARELSGVDLVAALPWPTREGVHHGLVLFLGGRQRLSDTQLLHALAAKLPAYMLPARVIWSEEMPLNPNGKLDRRALLATLREET